MVPPSGANAAAAGLAVTEVIGGAMRGDILQDEPRCAGNPLAPSTGGSVEAADESARFLWTNMSKYYL